MKKILIYIFLCLTFFTQTVLGQNQESNYIFWFKIQQVEDSLALLIKNNDTIAIQIFQSSTESMLPLNDSDKTYINYNSALNMNDSSTKQLLIPVLLKGKNAKTMMIVYQVKDSINENSVWTYKINDNKYLGLTTQNLITLSKKYNYADTNLLRPFINTIIFYTNEQATDSNAMMLLGKNDSLNFNGCIAEALLFDKHLKGNELTKWQTYFAVKYGIKLIEINYLNSNDTIIWEYTPDFNGAVAGIGCDSIYGLNQKQSRSSSDEDIISLGAGIIESTNEANNYVLEQYQFIIWANNELPLEVVNDTFNTRNDNADYMYYSLLQRQWLIKLTGTSTSTVAMQLKFDGSGLHVAPGDELYMLVDRSATGDFSPSNAILIEPDSITSSGMVYFNNLFWDTDESGKDMFTFSFIKTFANEFRNEELASDNGSQADTNHGEGKSLTTDRGVSYSLYPNPTAGAYHLEILSDTETSFYIRLLDVNGRVLKKYEEQTSLQFVLDAELPAKGVYIIEIQTDRELKIFKIVMK